MKSERRLMIQRAQFSTFGLFSSLDGRIGSIFYLFESCLPCSIAALLPFSICRNLVFSSFDGRICCISIWWNRVFSSFHCRVWFCFSCRNLVICSFVAPFAAELMSSPHSKANCPFSICLTLVVSSFACCTTASALF